uniref:Reverse transcriptase Ty1/copia-type domain-containing protein n=1 Tax=Cannabis sativa TaxID=3483 RepID=A0A803NMC5_CANSA
MLELLIPAPLTLDDHQVLAAIRGNRMLKYIQDYAPPPQFLSDADQAAQFLGARQILSVLEKHFTLQVSFKILEFRIKLQNLKKGPQSLNDYLLKTRIEGYSVAEIEALLLASKSRIEKTDKEFDLNANLTAKNAGADLDNQWSYEALLAHYNRNCRGSNSGFLRRDSNTPLQAHAAQTSMQAQKSNTKWFPDSGATNHCTPDVNNLVQNADYTGHERLYVGNGSEITKNLLSVSNFAQDNNVFFEFHPSVCYVKDLRTKAIILTGILHNGLYTFVQDQLQPSPTPQPNPIQQSVSQSNGPIRNRHSMKIRAKLGIFKPKVYVAFQEPTSVKMALQHEKWRNAMSDKMGALRKNVTWTYVPLPDGRTPIGCKWVYKIKLNADGTINKFKARLVAKCFHQQLGFDFTKTFSLVVKPVTIRIVLSLALAKGWCIQQLDINNAFLNGDLKEEVYMTQAPSFELPDAPHLVCKLNKAIYGLKQAPKAWFDKLHQCLLSFGFVSSKSDHNLFIQHTSHSMILLLVYVDEIIITGDPVENPQQYKYIVGALQYLTITKLEISYSVNKVCQFMSNPLHTHWNAAKRILRYLSGTISHGLTLQRSAELDVTAFGDADWASDPDDKRSTFGFSIFFGSNLVAWQCKKQHTVSRSSTEAEYRSLAQVVSEITWMHSLFTKIHVQLPQSLVIWCDNLSTILLTTNPVLHAKTKHIELDLYFVR